MDNWVNLKGRPVRFPVSDYLIDWDDDSLSDYQKRVKDFLQPFWSKTKVVLEEARLPNSLMSIDFINVTDKIAVEVQGEGHTALSNFFHGGSEAVYRAQLKRDLLKERWCELNHLTYIEVFPDDIAKLNPEWFKTNYNIDL